MTESNKIYEGEGRKETEAAVEPHRISQEGEKI